MDTDEKIGKKAILCPHCKSNNDPDAEYCNICGEKIGNNEFDVLKTDDIKLKISNSNEIFNEKKSRIDDNKKLVLARGRCPKCFEKVSKKLERLMKKGFKVRCEICDYPLN